MANLFTSQTPSSTDNSDGTPGITFATTVVFAVDGTVTGVRFYATTTVGGTYTGAIWTVNSSDPGTGTALATKTLGVTPTGGAWNTITFDSSVAVTAGTAYRVGVFSGAGRYVATLSFFGSALTNGDITAAAHNGTAGGFTVSQGTFRIDAAIGYPNSPGGGGTNYFADVEFTADVGVTGEGALILPAVTASGAGVASATGTSALTLPAVTASGAGTASASGTGTATLPAVTTLGTGTASAAGSGAPILPAVTASGFGGVPGSEPSAPGPTIRTTARDRTLRTSTRGG